MRVGFLQFNPIRKNVKQNMDCIKTLLAPHTFDLMVLPELANSGYLYEAPADLIPFSEPGDGSGEFLSAMQSICDQKDACLITGFSEKAADGILFNAAAAITRDGIGCIYRKMHLYNTEKTLFAPGDTGFKVFNYQGTRIGMLICFDWIFPEAARSLVLMGAQIIAHPANLVLPYCQAAMITRSLENGVFSITANRIGSETLGNLTLTFTGASQIVAPRGQVLATAEKTGEAVVIVEIDPKVASDKQISPHNHLIEDRRPEYYQ